jgi:hypothetical protein
VSCYHIRKMLVDYQGGELDEGQASAVGAHLNACAACRSALAELESEAAAYEAYAVKMESALDPAPESCERAMARASLQPLPEGDEHRPPGFAWDFRAFLSASPWVRQALAAALLVAISVTGTLIAVRYYPAKESPAYNQTLGRSSGDQSLDAALKSIQRAEQEYLDAIQILTGIIEKEKSTINPGMLADYQRNLKMIDEHIAAARKAYYAHPSDAELAFFMLAAYSRKVEILQDLAS